MRGVRGENGDGGMERNEDLKGVAKIWRESFAFLPGMLEALDRSFMSKKRSLSRRRPLDVAISHLTRVPTFSTDIPNISLHRLLSCTTSLSISHEALLRGVDTSCVQQRPLSS